MKIIYKKIAEFQQECPVIHKGTESYGYSYADLPSILEIINPILKKCGLGFTQLLDGENLKTIIFDIETGENLESSLKIPFDSLNYKDIQKFKDGEQYTITIIPGFEGMNTAQAIGSLITYFRRYTLSTALGIITDKDTDATGKTNKKQTYKTDKKQTDKEDTGLPWMSLNQKNNFLDMIKEGKGTTVKASMDAYRMKNIYKDEINKALNEALINDEPTNESAF